MKRFLIAGVFVGLIFSAGFSFQATAAECGLGPLVMGATVGDKGALRKSIGASTNVTFFPTYTLGITFGTLGCSSSGLVKKELDRQLFVTVNKDPLLQDMARGEGEFVNSMASLMGCPVMFYPAFGQMTQEHFENLTSQGTAHPADFVVNLREEIYSTPELAACDPLG